MELQLPDLKSTLIQAFIFLLFLFVSIRWLIRPGLEIISKRLKKEGDLKDDIERLGEDIAKIKGRLDEEERIISATCSQKEEEIRRGAKRKVEEIMKEAGRRAAEYREGEMAKFSVLLEEERARFTKVMERYRDDIRSAILYGEARKEGQRD